MPVYRFDTIGVAPLIQDIEFGGLRGDKALESNAILADLDVHGAKVLISLHPRRARPLKIDTEIHKRRRLIQTDRPAQRQDRPQLLSHDHRVAAVIHSQ